MLVSWVLLPLLLVALGLGWGLLAERIAGTRLPGALLPGVGMAAMIVAAQFPALLDATAELIVPLVAAGALVGVVTGARGREIRPDRWATFAGVAVFGAYAAPIVLSGEATFAGYIKLDDTATWLALTDHVMEHGRDLDGLAPSTYEATLAFNLGDGYPVGVFLPLGIGSTLTGTDSAWLIQPYMATWAAVLAVTLWEIGRPVVASAPIRAAAAFVAAQPALLVGYYLWGGIKEVAAIALVATAAALVPGAVATGRARAAVPLAIASAALVGVLSGGGVLWLAVPLGIGIVLSFRQWGTPALKRAMAVAVLVAALSLPVLLSGGALPPTSSPLTDAAALGNLAGPLDPLQAAGIWPAGDFRFEPEARLATNLLIVICLLGGAVGVTAAWRRRAGAALGLIFGLLATGALLVATGSPWVEGKALATASVAIPFAAMLGAGALVAAGRRALGVALGVVVAGGVLWSNAMAFEDVNLAPRQQLVELEDLSETIAGDGPTLLTEYQLYGARHFLRDAEPEAVSDLRRREIPRRDGEPVPNGLAADTDELRLRDVFVYETLVIRRSPVASRPPAAYERSWAGEFYDVWQRLGESAPSRHLPLGSAGSPVARPSCERLRTLAQDAEPGQTLLAARGSRPVEVPLSPAGYPDAWRDVDPSRPRPDAAGDLRGIVVVKDPGSYELWLGGGVRPHVEASVDRIPLGEARHQLQNDGGFVSLGGLVLGRGPHEVTVSFSGPDLHPGSDGIAAPVGPLLLKPVGTGTTVARVDPALAETLCRREWDWIELER